MRITADGMWMHQGAPILRTAMVRLFASILRRDPEGFVLVTPVEKLSIEVEDAPFAAIAMQAGHESGHGRLHFTTNVGDEIVAGAMHPIRFATDRSGGVIPYVLVRDELWARLTRSVAIELLQLVEDRVVQGMTRLGVETDGTFFALPDPSEPDDAGRR